MTKFEKQSIVWFIVYLVVLGSVILSTSSCTTTRRSGCPDTWFMAGYK